MEKITVLMAVYNPKQEWFEKQLKSINEQTYSNVELVICDDCSTELSFNELKSIVKRCVYKIPYVLQKNDCNIGSTKTFEKLTEQNAGDYFAYCDQDDIWEKEKLFKEWKTLLDNDGILACTNANIIYDNDEIVDFNSMSIPEKFKTNIEFGTAWKDLLIKNYFWGCTMLIKAEIAKKSLPFAVFMYHDHYLALYAATQGRIVFLNEALVKYRIHRNNQTGFLKDVFSKQDYKEKRIKILHLRYLELLRREFNEEQKAFIKKLNTWTLCRKEYADGQMIQFVGMLKNAKFNLLTTLFELFTIPMPDFMWSHFIQLLKTIKARK